MSGDLQIKTIFERWERLEGEKKAISDDLKELFSEAKHAGYDSKALRAAFNRKAKLEAATPADQHFEAIVDTYFDALNGSPRDARLHARENIEEFDPITGEFTESPRQAAEAVSERTAIDPNDGIAGSGMAKTEATAVTVGETTGEAASADLPANQPDTANETPKQVYGDSVEDATAPPSQSVEIPAGGDQGQKIDGSDDRCPAESHSPEQAIPSDDDAIAAVKGRARLANVADVEPPSSAPIAPASHGEAEAPSAERVSLDEGSSAAANTGGDHVEHEPSAATHQAGALVEPAPATPGYLTYEDFPPVPMKRTSFAHCFPELSAKEYDALGTSIAFEGVLEPIVRRGNVLLDGWSRYNIARNLGIQYPVIEYDGEDELLDVIRWQRAARKFTPAQSKKIAVELAKEVPHRASDILAAFELEMEEA